MRRPLRSTRCRVRASAFAVLSLGGLALGGVVVPAQGANGAGTIFREILARLRPGGLDQEDHRTERSATHGAANAHHRRGVASSRHRDSTAARARGPRLREAAYHLAENDLREGRHAEARRRFEELLATAPTRAEREFVAYRILLTDLLAGREEPAIHFLAEADRRGKRSPAYFYLQAALARQRGQTPAVQRWLAQAAAVHAQDKIPPAVRRRYADASRELDSPATEDYPHPAPDAPTPARTAARVALVEVLAASSAAPAPTPALAMRSLVPGGGMAPPSVAFRMDPTMEGFPPAGPTPLPEASRRPDPGRNRKDPAKPTPAPAPAATPTPPTGQSLAESPAEVRDKFEAAQGLYTRRDCPGALHLLDEIEAIQTNINEVRNLRALLHYELAYRQYIQQDYDGALHELDEADEAQAVADTANLRGLVLARQRQYDGAEAAFRRAIAADPTLWAAKFNLADLPFGYRNYTEARQRFEALTAETDRATQPRQAELTEFKVFLTLLLEGRESAARSFQSRFKPDGITPARLYAQAALDFHAGRFDRAIESVKDARKKYPPQLEAIFAESFYRVGWLTDALAAPNAATASTTPTPTPAVVAVAPSPLPETDSPSPSAAPTPEPATTASTPAPGAVTPAPTESTALAAATPSPAGPDPTASAPAAAVVSPPPAEAPPPAPAPTPIVAAAAKSVPSPPARTRSPGERFVLQVLSWGVLAYLLAPWLYAARVLLTRRRLRARRIVPLPRYPAADEVLESKKV